MLAPASLSLWPLSTFQAHASIGQVSLRDSQHANLELQNLTGIQDFLNQSSGFSYVEKLTLICSFIRSDSNNEAANALRDRLKRSSAPPLNYKYDIGVLTCADPAKVGAYVSLKLSQDELPEILKHSSSWQNFKFESLRNLFQFKKSNFRHADEELHERIRHALKSLTRRFSA